MWNPKTRTYDFPSITVQAQPDQLSEVARLEDAYTYNSVAGYPAGTTDTGGVGGLFYDWVYNGTLTPYNRVVRNGYTQINLHFVKRDNANNIYLSSDITKGANAYIHWTKNPEELGVMEDAQMGDFASIEQVFVDGELLVGEKTSQIGYRDPSGGEHPLFFTEPIQDALTIPDITDGQMKYFLKFYLGLSTEFTADIKVLYYNEALEYIGKSSETTITTTKDTTGMEVLAEGFDLPIGTKYVFLGVSSEEPVSVVFQYASIQVETCKEELHSDPTLLKTNTDHLFIRLLSAGGAGGGGGTVIPNDLDVETITLKGTATSTPAIEFDPTSGKQMVVKTDGDNLVLIAGGGKVDVSQAVISNCGAPSEATDVATKGYVDGKISGGGNSNDITATELNLNTETDGVPATLRLNGFFEGDFAQFQMSDGALLVSTSNKVIDLDNTRFSSSGAPVNDNDLTTKAYVDSVAGGGSGGGGSGSSGALPIYAFQPVKTGQWQVGQTFTLCEIPVDCSTFSSSQKLMYQLNIPCVNVIPINGGTTIPNFTVNYAVKFDDGAYGMSYAVYNFQNTTLPVLSTCMNTFGQVEAQQTPYNTMTIRLQVYVSSGASNGAIMTSANSSFATVIAQPSQ